MIDTHTHLYVKEFEQDRDEVVNRALNAGVDKMLLPNIDASSVENMLALEKKYPEHFFPMIGLHPTSVGDDFDEQMEVVTKQIFQRKYYGVGEIGIDLYWDKTFEGEQRAVFRTQLILAKEFRLPVSIHTRESFDIVIQIVNEELTDDLKGVFHCFTGAKEDAYRIMDTGFKMGVGGIVTFKNSGLAETLKDIPLEHLVLETDAPWLTPVPYRGKRNESSYLIYIAEHLAAAKGITVKEVEEITTENAEKLFRLDRDDD